MKKYEVTNKMALQEQIAGREPYGEISDNYVGDFISAETAEEAVELAIYYLMEQMFQNNNIADYEVLKHNAEIVVKRNGTAVLCYYDFKAKEVTE